MDQAVCESSPLDQIKNDASGINCSTPLYETNYRPYRFIEEKKQVRFRRELNANGETFSLFHIQSLTRYTNNCLRISLHLQQSNDFLHIRDFLRLRGCLGLTQQCTKHQQLKDSGRFKMEILLLNIAHFALE